MKDAPIKSSAGRPAERVDTLEGELRFYRSLYVLLDRQRDRLKSGVNHEIRDDLAEIALLQQQIEASERKIAGWRPQSPLQFVGGTIAPEAALTMGRVRTMVERCREIVSDSERLAAYRAQLDTMAQGCRLLAGMSQAGRVTIYLDERP
ncbi:MAG: hypothetical protein HY304_07250 [candidate division Zixibacteria bacterium]|nr:hypothetical protein [candidate division Zixibacteria bacterium]